MSRSLPLVVLFALAACSKPAVKTDPIPTPPPPAPLAKAAPAPAPTPVAEVAPVEEPVMPAPVAKPQPAAPSAPVVRFGFNSWYLDEAARASLAEYAASVRKGARPKLVIEGHADERGTAEYNLILGERRASAVRKYLGALGLDAKKIKTISYGENRPADDRHEEGAWALNRRAEVKPGTK